MLAGSKSVTELYLDDNEISEDGVRELVNVVYTHSPHIANGLIRYGQLEDRVPIKRLSLAFNNLYCSGTELSLIHI